MRNAIGSLKGDRSQERELAQMRAALDRLPATELAHVRAMHSAAIQITRGNPRLGMVAIGLLTLEMLCEWDPVLGYVSQGASDQTASPVPPANPPSPVDS